MDLVIRNATIVGVSGVKDIGVRDGRIVEISDRIELRGVEEIQAMGFLVAPGFMDVHQHMDKALILERHDWSRHPRDMPAREANIAASNELKRHFTVEDVRERVIRTAEMCIVNGTTTVRTHAEVDPVIGLTGIQGVLAAKEACRDWIDIQVDCYGVAGFHEVPEEEDLLRKGLEMGADLVGGVPEADPDGNAHVDRIFSLAKEYNKDIDFHVDQVRASRPFALPYITEKTIAEGWQGRVMASHCYALGHVTPEERRQAIAGCREAGVSICCDPNASIEERIIEPVNGGVNVTYMSDNIRDTWQPFGNADMLQLALFVAKMGSWRTKEQLDHLLEMGNMGAARAIGLAEDHGVGIGKRADLVIFEAKSGHEAIITQARKLWVIKNGRAVARNGELLVRSVV